MFAERVGVDQAHLTRIVQGKKLASSELARRGALALDLPEDYFAEVREAVVIEAVRTDPELRDRIYRQITRTST